MKVKKIRTLIITLIVLLFMVSVVSADDKAKFYASKSHYHHDQDVKLTLKNEEKKSIFIPCDGEIKIKNKNGQTVANLDWDLEGYGCNGYENSQPYLSVSGDHSYNFNGNLYELEKDHIISQKWDDDDRDHVKYGKYKAYTKYYDHDFDRKEVHTDSFELKK